MLLRHLVPWPSVVIHLKFYGDRPAEPLRRGRGLNAGDVVSGAHCVKVVDKAITMDNLRLLCLAVNVCRGTARRPRYKYFITARWTFFVADS